MICLCIAKRHYLEFGELNGLTILDKSTNKSLVGRVHMCILSNEDLLFRGLAIVIFCEITYILRNLSKISLITSQCLIFSYGDVFSSMNYLFLKFTWLAIPFLFVFFLCDNYIYKRFILFLTFKNSKKLNITDLPEDIQNHIETERLDVDFYTFDENNIMFFCSKFKGKDAIILEYPPDLFCKEEISSIIFLFFESIKVGFENLFIRLSSYLIFFSLLILQFFLFFYYKESKSDYFGGIMLLEIYFIVNVFCVPLNFLINRIIHRKTMESDLYVCEYSTPKTFGKALSKMPINQDSLFYITAIWSLYQSKRPSLYHRLKNISNYCGA